MVEFTKKASEALADIERVSAEFKRLVRDLDNRRDPSDLRDQALLIQCCRFIKFLDCYLMVARLGHPEPADALLRSLYETTVWARWVVSSSERAKRYFDAGKADMARMAMRLVNRGLASVKNAQESDVFMVMLKADVKANRLPRTDEMANDTGLADLHALVYGFLSSSAHGSLLGGGISPDTKCVSFDPQPEMIEPTLPLPYILAEHTALLYSTWMEERRIPNPPDVRGLMGKE